MILKMTLENDSNIIHFFIIIADNFDIIMKKEGFL